jgi:acetolactate synthase small subunit
MDKAMPAGIYERFDGTTWYLQKVLNQLFATRDSVVVSDVDEAVEQIINQNEEAYNEAKAKQITGMAFVKRHHLSSASSVQKSALALTEKQLLTHQQGTYEVYDKFMSEWLRKS